MPIRSFSYSFVSFLRHNANGGMALMVAAALAMVIANSPWSDWYFRFFNYPVSLQIGDFNLFSHHGHPFTLTAFINDALMAIFFFHVGLEVKREILVGELSTPRKAALPVVAACGGMIIPVCIYLLIAHASPESRGAAIPMATDIAFSLGVLSLLGKRVPLGLKVFLTALAVVDDIGGILVIAFVYTSGLQIAYLLVAGLLLSLLVWANRQNTGAIWLYIIVGIAVWYLFLQSGVHSTVAGVLVAFTIPSRLKPETGKNTETASNRVISPLQQIENRLHGVVNYFIMPLFAFVNAGIVFSGSLHDFFGVVTFAVALGLILGKFIGIFSFTWLGVKLKVVSLPDGSAWKPVAGIAMLSGIGFTVSLFIANLSFGHDYPMLLDQAKLGIVAGSVISGVLGYVILQKTLPKGR